MPFTLVSVHQVWSLLCAGGVDMDTYRSRLQRGIGSGGLSTSGTPQVSGDGTPQWVDPAVSPQFGGAGGGEGAITPNDTGPTNPRLSSILSDDEDFPDGAESVCRHRYVFQSQQYFVLLVFSAKAPHLR